MLKLAGLTVTALAGLALVATIVVVVFPASAAWLPIGNRAAATPVAAVTPTPAPSPSESPLPSPSPTPSPSPPNRTASLAKLTSDLNKIAAAGGARASVSLVELAGVAPIGFWSIKGDSVWQADSTYKLPLLMAEAQGIASGKYKTTDSLCYKSSDYEAGWYDDYAPGECFTRNELAARVGHYSDNTAAHILVRYLGGSAGLNAFARTMGATGSKFFVPNTTTSADLARLWAAEVRGLGGGPVAQKWLYPLLTKTYWESGIPAGTPRATVVHKVGFDGKSINDAAFVVNGPKGGYILTICTYGPGNAAGWNVIASMAKRVYQFEAARPS